VAIDDVAKVLLVPEREDGDVEQRVARGRLGPVDDAGSVCWTASWPDRLIYAYRPVMRSLGVENNPSSGGILPGALAAEHLASLRRRPSASGYFILLASISTRMQHLLAYVSRAHSAAGVGGKWRR
jgi:hypothetical protein